MAGKKRAVFLDRDGTINVEKEYLYRIEELSLIDGVPEAIGRLKSAGFTVIVVTNQSGIGRGYYDESALCALHAHLDRELVRFGTAVDAYYFCPHHPEHGIGTYRRECSCRKPLPGMLHQAAEDFDIDLAASYIVGDKLVDVEAGIRAGCRPFLVRTGCGAASEARLPDGVVCCDDLPAAVEIILADKTLPPGSRCGGGP